MQTLIDDYIVPLTESNDPDFTPLASALLKIAMIYILGILCSYIYNRIMVNVSQGTMKTIRIKLFNHMQSLPIQYFDSHSHGDIMSIYTNDTDTLRQFLSQSVPQLFNSIITIVSIFVAMITLNIPLTIITLVIVAVMLVVAKNAAALSSKYFNQQQNNLGKLNGFIEEMISGQKVVKVFCYEKRSLARFRSVNEELKESSQKANIYGNILMPVIMQIGNVSYVICAVIGSILILNEYGGLSVGMLVSFLTLNKNFNQPFGQVSQQLNSIIMATAGINRFYDIQDGKIRYDNINIRKIKKADLRKSLGVVLQDTHLFTGTIIDNIRYGRLDATDEECIQAAKLANADGFIRMLPYVYQTVISGDGESLSQGQRQLLAIARAAVANPPVLVLDEATSSIDTHTEELVQNGMDKLMEGRTTFVIAHRLSTIRNADCIMVLENGRIIERGNHEQLIEEKGRYYELYTGNSISG